MVHVTIDKETCIGCGTCAAVCSENFEMDGDKAKVKNANPKEIGCNKEAEEKCPVDAITVK